MLLLVKVTDRGQGLNFKAMAFFFLSARTSWLVLYWDTFKCIWTLRLSWVGYTPLRICLLRIWGCLISCWFLSVLFEFFNSWSIKLGAMLSSSSLGEATTTEVTAESRCNSWSFSFHIGGRDIFPSIFTGECKSSGLQRLMFWGKQLENPSLIFPKMNSWCQWKCAF